MENIKLNALLFKTLFLLLTFWTSPALGQTSIGCNMDGECKGSLYMDVSSQETVGDCLEQCQATIGCQYWTYYRESKGCLGFVNCDHLTAEDCTDCVSGDKGCEPYQCDIQGRCSGTLEEFLVAPSSDYCADKCHEHVNCTWWTYDSSSTRFCTLLADCPILDKSCLSCISGEAGCWVESTLPPDTEGKQAILNTT